MDSDDHNSSRIPDVFHIPTSQKLTTEVCETGRKRLAVYSACCKSRSGPRGHGPWDDRWSFCPEKTSLLGGLEHVLFTPIVKYS